MYILYIFHRMYIYPKKIRKYDETFLYSILVSNKAENLHVNIQWTYAMLSKKKKIKCQKFNIINLFYICRNWSAQEKITLNMGTILLNLIIIYFRQDNSEKKFLIPFFYLGVCYQIYGEKHHDFLLRCISQNKNCFHKFPQR